MLQFVPAELQQLYQYLELEFNPLLLCKRVSPILEGLASDEILKDYSEPLREITLVRLIKEVRIVICSIGVPEGTQALRNEFIHRFLKSMRQSS